jgi:AraC family transcriptional regulator
MVPKISNSPVLTKKSATWGGLRIDHCRVEPGELPRHHHREHTVLIVLSDGARGEFLTDSGSGLCGTHSKGSVAVIPSGLEHQAILDQPSEHLSLFIDPAVINRAATDSSAGRFELIERYSHNDNVILNIGLSLKDELYSEGLSGRLYADSLANLLAVHLLRHYSTPIKETNQFYGGISAAKLRRVTDYIADNYAQDLRIDELAGVANMSAFHFVREFKRTTGTTPHQYLIKFRVDKAKLLLANEELPLIEVGLRTGFSHQSHFTRLFRRETGITPQSYRNQSARTVND